MPWLSIIMALVSFLLAGGTKKENRAKAAAIAVGVGAATYGVSHYTDWGAENLGALDGVSVTGSGATAAATTTDGSTVETVNTSPTPTGSSGFWSSLGGLASSPLGSAAVGAVAGATIGTPVLWIALAVGAFLILKG